MMKKQLRYDDAELVELIGEGQLTYKAIAEKLGISESLVRAVAQGRRRVDLARRLWDGEEGMMGEARRTAARYARHLLMEQIRLGLEGKGEPARRAREFVLKFTVSARPRRKDVPIMDDPIMPEAMREELLDCLMLAGSYTSATRGRTDWLRRNGPAEAAEAPQHDAQVTAVETVVQGATGEASSMATHAVMPAGTATGPGYPAGMSPHQ